MTTATLVTATESRARIPGYRCATTVARSLSCRRSTASMGITRAFDAGRLERFRGGAPKTVPMVVDPADGGAASHASSDAWEFFTGKNAPPRTSGVFGKWRNEVTLRSLEMYSEYEPGSFVERIAPTPLLMITDVPADDCRRPRRRLPDRSRAGSVQPCPRTEAARAESRRSLLRLHRSVRPRSRCRDGVVHRAPATCRQDIASAQSEAYRPCLFAAVGHLHFRSAAPRLAASCKYHVRRHNRLPCPRIERED
jgi:hypothetical protein